MGREEIIEVLEANYFPAISGVAYEKGAPIGQDVILIYVQDIFILRQKGADIQQIAIADIDSEETLINFVEHGTEY